MPDFSLEKALIVVSSGEVRAGTLCVSGDGLVSGLSSSPPLGLGYASVVYPALINTHDHFQGNYLPPVGPAPGSFYLTWRPWDNDLKASATFAERSRLSREDLYRLSGYKCLFSGVATAVDHFPQAINREILPTLPLRVIRDYGLAHEATPNDLHWGDGIAEEHRRAAEHDWPFITHLSEGFDEESMRSLENLAGFGLPDGRCLLAHCIGFSDADIAAAARAGASVAWCPASNMRMFNVTAKIRKMLRAGINVSLGTDSSATGSVNLLEEMRYARRLYRELYGEDLDARILFGMVTANAARAFRLQDRLGTLEAGKTADLLVLRRREEDPFENLASASMEDIELLTLAGKPLYGEPRFAPLFGKGGVPPGYTTVTVGGKTRFITGDPAALYTALREKTGFRKVLDFLPFEPEAANRGED
ncbi:MAG: amidohydrolase family protein [Spirochaetaceae bacterium]|nr:amidohydrolase family protein [Spirochaetaceae bacterium]